MKNNISRSAVMAMLAAALLLAGSSAVFAQRGKSATSTVRRSANTEQRIARIKAKSLQEIDRRLTSLNKHKSIIQNMRRLTAAQKGNLTALIDSQITSLSSLRTKVEADTDLETLRNDAKTITQSHRIYALVIPQAQILAAADRMLNTADLLTQLAAKLEERIHKAKTDGREVVSLETALADMKAKIAGAKTQAEAAITAVASLTPDNGDEAKWQSNRNALTDARAKLKAGRVALRGAHQQARTIRQGLSGNRGTATTTPATPSTGSTGSLPAGSGQATTTP